MEAKSIGIDFIGEEQLKDLLHPQTDQAEVSVEAVVAQDQVAAEDPTKAPQPVVSEPVKQEVEVEPATPEPETAEEQPPAEAPNVSEEDWFEPPQQTPVLSDQVEEIETIESAIPVERISREGVNRQFNSLIGGLKVDLGRRSQTVAKREEQQQKDQKASTRVRKVQTIVSDNQELFKQNQIVAKWKTVPLSRMMQKEYMPKVDEVIKSHWKLPLEMDPDLEILVSVVVAKTGAILNYEVVEATENRFFNHAVVQVFKNLNQLPPLPEGFTGESTEIGLRFTSKQFHTQ